MLESSARRRSLAAPLALLWLVMSAAVGHAKCDPTTEPDKSDIAAARAAIAANCDCAAAQKHGDYVSCAAQQANTVLVNKSCAGTVKKCASHSTCGKPLAVTCCRTTSKGTKCTIKKDAAHCTAKQGIVGACTSCCDACASPGGGPSCSAPTSTTTTTTTSSSCPPSTAFYCGVNACGGPPVLCPLGMTCVTTGTTCACTGTTIPCGDPGLGGAFCQWGTCPDGMTCGGVPKAGTCGFDCVCH
jgi:hypothetical protein